MTKVTVSNRQTLLRVRAGLLRRLVEFVAEAEGGSIDFVDVAVVDAGQIESLNRRYLDRSDPTDVLSFDLADEDAEGIYAQIVVCSEVAMAEAPRHGLSPEAELMLYVVHGLLHLMGYDDTTGAKAARMRSRQDELLGQFDLQRQG